jgi:hypothetical protein
MPSHVHLVPTSDQQTIQITMRQLIPQEQLQTYLHLLQHAEIYWSKLYKKQTESRNKTCSQTNPNEAADVIQVATPMKLGVATHKLLDTIFIGDSGATCHMRYSSTGKFNLTPCQTAATVGNNKTMYSQAIGSLKATVHNTDDTSFPIILTYVLYVPDLWLNLLSITKATQHDYVKLGSPYGNMTLSIGPHQMTVDLAYPTASGRILEIFIIHHSHAAVYLTATPIAIETFHQQVGRPNL